MSLDLEGKTCPVCKSYLFEVDDVVVCPICGAPHHRDCYQAIGHCALEQLHGTDRQYDKTQHDQEDEPAQAADVTQKTCPNCDRQSPSDSLFCPYCGFMFGSAARQQNYGSPFSAQGGFFTVPVDPYGGVKRDTKIDDVALSDAKEVVLINTPRYLPKFAAMNGKKKRSWNWLAFLFPQAWLFLRKAYVGGLLAFLAAMIGVVCSIPMNLEINSLLSTLPVDAVSAQRYAAIMAGPYSTFAVVMWAVSLVFSFAVRIVCGLFGDYIYRQNVVRVVKKVRQNADLSPDEVVPELQRRGGVNVFAFALAMLATSWLPMLLLYFF